MIRTILALSLLLGTAAAGLAQPAAVRPPHVLRVPASARAAAMGNAHLLGAVDADGLFYNPAFAEALRGVAGGAAAYGARGSYFGAAGGVEWWGGGAGLGLQALEYAVPAGAAGAPAEVALGRRGEVPISEHALTVGYARRFRGVRVGASGKFIEQRIQTSRGRTAAVDVAAGADVGAFRAGLALQHLGPALTVGGESARLPSRATLGLASRAGLPLGPIDLAGAASVSASRGGEVLPALGFEVGWWPVVGRTFFGRIGARRVEGGEAGALTLGAGFAGDRIALDYAVQRFDGFARHHAGLRWR
jgi:hypothetical protein